MNVGVVDWQVQKNRWTQKKKKKEQVESLPQAKTVGRTRFREGNVDFLLGARESHWGVSGRAVLQPDFKHHTCCWVEHELDGAKNNSREARKEGFSMNGSQIVAWIDHVY